MKPYTFTKPPTTLRRAKLDNLALVPASLLPFKKEWQAVANSLPKGTVLIIMPDRANAQRRTLENVATVLEAKGHKVTALPEEQLARV